MKHDQLNLKNQSNPAIINSIGTNQCELDVQNFNTVKNVGTHFQKNQVLDENNCNKKLRKTLRSEVKINAAKLRQTDECISLTMIEPLEGMDLAKKAFVKARIRYPKRRISNENLEAVKQEMMKSMFAPLVDHLSTLNLSLYANQINFALVNHELREFDSKLFNKLMAQVYYRKPRRSKTTSVPINNIILEALKGTLWQHACKLKNAAFLNSTLLYLLACLDPEKANKVYKEILNQAEQ